MVTSKKEHKRVLHREVIRFLTGSGKTIRNNWKDRNETEQKKMHFEEGSLRSSSSRVFFEVKGLHAMRGK